MKARVISKRLKTNKTGLSQLTTDQLHELLRVLARPGKSYNIPLIHTILAEMPDVLGIEVSLHTYSIVFDALVESGNYSLSYDWLIKMQKRPGGFSPTLPQWHTWLKAFIPLFDQRKVQRVLIDMEHSGCIPTLETYRILLTRMFGSIPNIDIVKSILHKKSSTLPYDPTIISLLRTGYSKRGSVTLAETTTAYYKSLYRRDEPSFDDVCNTKLLQAYQHRNRHRASVEYNKLRLQGFVPTVKTLHSLLVETAHVQDLKFWEETLKVPADVAAWTCLIRNCAPNSGSVERSLEIYEEFKSSNLTADSGLIIALIRILCMKTLRLPNQSHIDKALVIYQEHFRNTSIGEPKSIIYNMLISALASTTDIETYFPKALTLLDEMQSRKVAMDSMTATSIIVLLLRSSPSPSEAFQAYKRLFKRSDGTLALDAEGFVAVLNVFCRLTYGKRNIHTAVPPWEQYFEIVKDMRDAGYQVNIKVYTIILQQLGLAATKFRQALNLPEGEQPGIYQLQRAIRKIHQLMTIDASVEPDTVAWNTLMDAYQRAGCLREAYRVWDSLWVTRNFDNVSVSIIADACGHANALHEAYQIFTRLRSIGYVLNLRNWNAWLECLCRLGRINDAVKLMCMEMTAEGNSQPDAKTVATILRFALGTKEESQIRERIKRYLPELWASLPDDLVK